MKSDRHWAAAIGIGLALFPIHNKWLTDLTSVNGQATLFLPVFGSVIWILATLFFIRDNWHRLNWGDKKVYVPLLVIVGAIGLSGITDNTWGGKVAPLLMGLSLLSLYLATRILGKDVFLPLAIGAGVASLGIIAFGIWHLGLMTGGAVFEKNYDAATGFVLLGAALFIHKWQWLLAGLALVAMFLSGSPEAVFALGVLGMVVLLRQDWSRKMAVVVLPVVLVALLWFGLGSGQKLYSLTSIALRNRPVSELSGQSWRSPTGRVTPRGVVEGDTALERRWANIKRAVTGIKPLGEGYNLTEFSKVFMVHNVPLVIVQQLGWPGILAGLAWLWVSVWCLVKTRLKYVWVLVLSLSLWDHYIWTQLAPWWWVIVGVSTAGGIKSDLLFRSEI